MSPRIQYVHVVIAQTIVGAADTLAAVAGEDILATSHPQYPEPQ